MKDATYSWLFCLPNLLDKERAEVIVTFSVESYDYFNHA